MSRSYSNSSASANHSASSVVAASGPSEAAAGLPPTLEVSTESFAPGQPEAPFESEGPPLDSDAPSAPVVDGEPSGVPTP